MKPWLGPLLALALAGGAPRAALGASVRGGDDVFAKVAPATVIVRTNAGHGTGIIIDRAGFVLTNYHVIADGMTFDEGRHASMALVHLGKLRADGTIAFDGEPVLAEFHGSDKERDLALLRIVGGPKGRVFPFVALSDKPPHPGQRAAMVGHPGAGMLWTFRTCEVAAVGRSPGDLVENVFERLHASEAERSEIDDDLAALPSRRIVLSSCEANPGDSGGPLVDEAGKLLAVTYAIPEKSERSKFTYHVHLDEVRAFLAQRHTTPAVLLPDAWNLPSRVRAVGPEVLAAGVDRSEQFLLDLDGDTDPASLESVDDALLAAHRFDAEFALHRTPDETVVFYDTDNDGTFDYIKERQLRTGEPAVDITFTRVGGGWDIVTGPPTGELVDPRRFKDAALGRRLTALMPTIGAK